ncbi:hypothetical protein MC885_017378, partial [Smutsia gigantea]
MDSPTPAQSTWAQERGGTGLRTWCASGREVARGCMASLAAPATQPTKHGPRLRKMALPAQQIPRWFNSINLSRFITAAQLGKCFQRPRKTLLHGFSAQPQMSSEDCFLQWGFKTYRTSSLCNNSQFTNSRRQEINSAQSTLLPSVKEQSQKTQNISSFDSELSLEELDDLPPLSPLQLISEEEAVQIVADPPLPPASFTLRDYVDHSETLQKLVLL